MAKDLDYALDQINALDKQISTHEQVCAERWLESLNRLKRLEIILISCTGALLLFLSQMVIN
jgi:hypothetical protein